MAQWMPGNNWGRAPQLLSSHCMIRSCKYRVPVPQLPRPADSQLLGLCAEACAPRACSVQFSAAQSLSRVLLFATPWTAAHQASLSITNSQSAPKHHWVSDAIHLILCHPLLLLPSSFPASGLALCIRWPKYWSFSFNISPSNEHSGLISFRMDRLDLLAVQGTLKSLLQHHSSKASILHRSAFFIVQLWHPSVTTGKTIALTRWTFVGKVMSLLFNMPSRLVITFLPRSMRLLISWLQSPSAEPVLHNKKSRHKEKSTHHSEE